MMTVDDADGEKPANLTDEIGVYAASWALLDIWKSDEQDTTFELDWGSHDPGMSATDLAKADMSFSTERFNAFGDWIGWNSAHALDISDTEFSRYCSGCGARYASSSGYHFTLVVFLIRREKLNEFMEFINCVDQPRPLTDPNKSLNEQLRRVLPSRPGKRLVDPDDWGRFYSALYVEPDAPLVADEGMIEKSDEIKNVVALLLKVFGCKDVYAPSMVANSAFLMQAEGFTGSIGNSVIIVSKQPNGREMKRPEGVSVLNELVYDFFELHIFAELYADITQKIHSARFFRTHFREYDVGLADADELLSRYRSTVLPDRYDSDLVLSRAARIIEASKRETVDGNNMFVWTFEQLSNFRISESSHPMGANLLDVIVPSFFRKQATLDYDMGTLKSRRDSILSYLRDASDVTASARTLDISNRVRTLTYVGLAIAGSSLILAVLSVFMSLVPDASKKAWYDWIVLETVSIWTQITISWKIFLSL